MTPSPPKTTKQFTESSMNPRQYGSDFTQGSSTVPEFSGDDRRQTNSQTGFDQPKLCAMYLDKKIANPVENRFRHSLASIEWLQARDTTFVVDFVNEPQVVLDAFREVRRRCPGSKTFQGPQCDLRFCKVNWKKLGILHISRGGRLYLGEIQIGCCLRRRRSCAAQGVVRGDKRTYPALQRPTSHTTGRAPICGSCF